MTPHAIQPLIEGVLEAVWLVDAIDLHVRGVNRAAEALFGLPRSQMLGRPVVDFASTSQDVFFWEDVAAGRSDNIYSETLVTRPDGSLVQIDRRVSKLAFSGGPAFYVVAMLDRSAQHRAEHELETIISELRATLESTADGILVLDMDGAIRGYNHRFAEMWDLPEMLLTKRDDQAVFAWMEQHVTDKDSYSQRIGQIDRSPLLEAQDLLVLRSGKVLDRVTLPQYARGRPIGRVFSFRDVTQRLADEARLKLAARVFESSIDAIFVANPRLDLIAANPAFQRMTGFADDEIEHLSSERFLAERESGKSFAQLQESLIEHDYWQGELWARRKSGEAYPCLLSLVRVPKSEAGDESYIGFFKDLTEAREAQRRIEELAYSDALTGLPNRVMLQERFQLAIAHAVRSKQSFATFFIDLDRFKQINDSLGHAFGDRVLVEVAERLRLCLRQVDTAARLGGDEFILLLNKVDAVGAETAARRVLNALAEPIELDDMRFNLSCSIGIAMYPGDGTDMDELIKNADSAMYAVKERGRSDFRFYQRQMNIGLLARVKLDQALRQALKQGRLQLHYQPKVDLNSGQVVGVEALARWHDEEYGNVLPARFIPVAEESGAIVPLGAWVLDQAVTQAGAWRKAGLLLPVAINISAVEFNQSGFVKLVAEALERHQVPGECLELELTESILVVDANEAMARLKSLRELGVRLSIDDFGTGYSSLAYLKRFPVERLKIDQSFVADIPGDQEDEAIAVAVIELGRALKLRVTAEGVENQAQLDFLKQRGCTEGQGFHFSKALPAPELTARFAKQLVKV
ncbi:sensor domain-containing protein [Pseudomarimonas arenosa]|uniref:cyclic-guanylate-specific phosphodiesterase n=1 Tax=Pseudomarimonas arenosa TaxID=2774145 RepID=A0AAW3ZMB8_9GAMM|nr:EAL domain-containing protein [Pseudomarimonas arenosa]MBD8527206.1 EAL domain-containing protein [Pseudomarimonas arenosa]